MLYMKTENDLKMTIKYATLLVFFVLKCSRQILKTQIYT